MIRGVAVAIAALGITATSVFLAPAAYADSFTCPDSTVVDVESGESFAITVVCAGHMDPTPIPTQTPSPTGDATPIDTQPKGTWVYAGPVCDNVGICASNLLCADGTPMVQYVFVEADGTRGEAQIYCPGDPDIPPVPEVVPPTPGEIFTAFKEVVPSAATLVIQPPNGQTLVNFETVFSTKADAFTTEQFELVRGYTAQFEIFPTDFYWNFGDGAELRTDSAGKAWESGDDVSTLITHVYTSTDPVKASVTTRWGANVRLNGGASVAVEGTVDKTSELVPLEILEAVPELVK